METPSPIPATWSPYLLSVMRIAAVLTYITHGTQKMFGEPTLRPRPPVQLFSSRGLASVIEVFGGPVLVLGLFTRPLAFLFSGEMAFAYFLGHAPRSFWPLLNAGETSILLCFLYLYLAAAGGGAWSLDRLLRRGGPPSPIPAKWAPYLLSVLRIVAALVFIAHGVQKMFGVPALEPQSPVPLVSFLGLAAVIEVCGGALLLLGVFTRPLAFLFVGETAAMYVIVHAPRNFWPVLNLGEPIFILTFIFLYLSAAGGGAWRLDRLFDRTDQLPRQ